MERTNVLLDVVIYLLYLQLSGYYADSFAITADILSGKPIESRTVNYPDCPDHRTVT